MKKYDLIVLGGGTAGMNLVHPVAAAGWKTAVIEEKQLGGTCINVGCIPSKTLISSGRVMHTVRDARRFGVICPEPRADWPAMVARKEALVERIRSRVYGNVEKRENLDFYPGRAVFRGQDRVEVAGEVLQAEKIVIATGSRTALPPLPGLDEVDYLTSTSVMEMDHLPESLLIIGGGIIALEFSQLFARLGVAVTVLQRDTRLAPSLEEEVSAEILKILEGEGVKVVLGAAVSKVGPGEKGGIYALAATPGGERRFGAEQLLLAVGRQPNSDGLGLEDVGVATDKRGYIVVDDSFSTGAGDIRAIGDVTGGMMFTHRAWHDALLLSRFYLQGQAVAPALGRRLIPFAIFTEPEIAGVGLSEAAAREAGYEVAVKKFPFAFQGRARAMDKYAGFIRLVVDEAGGRRILGCQIIGPEAGELIHELITAMRFGASTSDLATMIHVHPTLSEAINNTANLP